MSVYENEFINSTFSRCSIQVEVQLFKSFCICFYNIGLWENFHVYCLNKFASAYVKCIKIFFGFHKYSSVTNMLQQLGLPSFDMVLHNARIRLIVLPIICTCLIIVLCLCHAGCDMTACMRCFCTCVCFQVFSLFFIVFLFFLLCVFVCVVLRGLIQINKERKKERLKSLAASVN